MYVAPESKVLVALANVVSTSPTVESSLEDADTLPDVEFEE